MQNEATIVFTHNSDGPLRCEWVGPSHWPVRFTVRGVFDPELPSLPWPLRLVRYDAFCDVRVMARADGWRWFTWAFYRTTALAQAGHQRLLCNLFRWGVRTSWFQCVPGIVPTWSEFFAGWFQPDGWAELREQHWRERTMQRLRALGYRFR